MTALTHSSGTRLGAAAFVAGSVLVHAGNYAFNLVAVRFLTPADYADVALAVTLLLLAGFVTVGFQLATARTVAERVGHEAAGHHLARWFGRRALWVGLGLGSIMALASPNLAVAFNTGSTLPFLAVASALPLALAVGVGRGAAQGSRRFGRLALSYQAEMLVRLGLGAGLLAAGFGVAGALGALTLSLLAAALTIRPSTGESVRLDPVARGRLAAALWPSMALLVGEAMVNHVDTVIVKHAFDPTIAGQFAALALIGRSVFFVTWPVSMLVFPIAARRAAEGVPTRGLLGAAVAAVALVGTLATTVAAVASDAIVTTVLGTQYLSQAHLLAPYVAASALFSCAATVVSFSVATGVDAAALAAAAAGAVVVLMLSVFHRSLDQVVWLQVALMASYAGTASMWVLRRGRVSR